MTPFEQAKANVKHLANGLYMCELIQKTIEDCEGLTEEESDLVWTAILTLLQASGKFNGNN